MRNTTAQAKKKHVTAGAAAALVPLLALTAAACGTEGGGTGSGSVQPAPAPKVAGVHWAVQSVTVDGKKSGPPAEGAHLTIEKGRASGSLGCNGFSAKAEVKGDTVTVSERTSTEKACPGPASDFEAALSDAFTGKLTAKSEKGGALTLTGADGKTIRLAEQPATPLEGTDWTVESLVKGETTASLPKGTEAKATMVFGKDGSLRGNLGCNSFSTTVKKSGATLAFDRVTSTRKLCAGPEMELERALTKTLEGGKATYGVENRTLTVTAADGTGFTAQAAAAAK
ncbi:META domain-containing protein [Streptomyces lichenis]|uniref:META domain-containing protein n=1 Tax=Streptomyces lichenis TaxID=2306967 RepID=A0ABT0I564_9ACTN|nr:META domain-containing protein [Streptomyces lichenis]MCK8676461.1 META domain-containing protein [Streptomyces lichenis]